MGGTDTREAAVFRAEEPGFPPLSPEAVVSRYVRQGIERDGGSLQRAFAGFGELSIVAVEVAVAVAVLRLKNFNLWVVGVVTLWALIRIVGFWRRARHSERSRLLMERGLAALETRDYAGAVSSLGEAFRLSHREEAGLGYTYSAGKQGDMREMLHGARLLFRVNLYHRSPDAILGKRECQALLAEPDFRAVRPRLRAILVGDDEELVHLAPGILRERAVQVVIGLLSFTLIAFVLTAILTFL
jgi:hypothetical protein